MTSLPEWTTKKTTVPSIVACESVATQCPSSVDFVGPQCARHTIIFQDIIIKDRQIKYASGTKFLGIWLDKNLTWDLHIDNLVCKLSKLCYALRTSRKLIDDKVARIMYYAYCDVHASKATREVT
jgi:hypothetical protein